jgi:multicomponent Na+:H+ antiporter subunit G
MEGKEALPHLMIQDVIVCLFLLLGSALMLVASIGLVRLPDPLSRAHALTKATTWGISLLLIALWLALDDETAALKILLVIIFCLLTTPLSGHLVASLHYRQLHRKERPFTRKTKQETENGD